MYKLPSDSLNARTHPTNPPASSNPEGSTGGLANFQFKKIGQPPALLQRISESGPDIDMSKDYDEASRSPSPDLEDELLISDSSPETMNTGQPSLIARIAMAEPRSNATDAMNVEEAMPHLPDFPTTFTLSRTSGRGLTELTTGGGLQSNSSTIFPSSDPTNANSKASYASRANSKINPSTHSSASSSNNEPAIGPLAILPQLNITAASAYKDLNSDVNPPPSMQQSPTVSQPPVPADDTQSHGATSSSTQDSSLPSHRDLQRQLSFALSNVHPVNTANIMHLSQSNQAQCTEIISAFRNAYEQAQPIVASINQYFEVMQKCIRDFDTLQTRVNMLSDVAKRLDLGQNGEWIDKVKSILSQMDQRIRIDDQAAREAEIRREKELEVVNDRMRARSVETAPASNAYGALSSLSFDESSQMNVDNAHRLESNLPLPSVEDEANAARQAWSKVCEENAARKKSDEEEIARGRATQDALEAYLARVKAANAEVEERARVQRDKDEQLEAQKMEETKRTEELARKKADDALARMRVEEEEREKLLAEEKEKENERTAKLQKKLTAEREERVRRAHEEEERKCKEEEQKRKKEEQKRKNAEAELKRIDDEERRQQQALQRQHIVAEKQKHQSENAKKAQAARAQTQTTHSPRESISHSRVSNASSGPSGAEASVSSISTTLRNLAPPIATAIVSSNSPGKALSEQPRTGIPVDRTSLQSQSSSNRVSPIAETGTRPQPYSTSIVLQSETERNEVAKRLSTSLPSPSDAINVQTAQKNVAGSHMTQAANPSALSKLPARPLTPHTTAEQDISVDRQSRDAGNLLFLPHSQILPISPDAQKANLRRLSEHHRIPVKPEPDEEKSSVKTESSLSLQNTSSSSISTLQNDILGQKLKVEPPDDTDIPRLSMPPSPSSPEPSFARDLPTLPQKPKAKLSTSKPQPKLAATDPRFANQSTHQAPNPHNFQNVPILPAKVVHQGTQSKIPVVSPGSHMHASMHLMLPNAVTPLSQAPCHIAVNDFFDDADSRMGPDVDVPGNGWGQPSQPSPVEARSLEQRRRNGPRAPQNIDHYSPSPSPPLPSRTPPPQRSRMLMPRRGDHYSPRRSPEPLSGYARASPGPSHFRRSDSASNSRDVSPANLPVNQGQGFARPHRNTHRSSTPEGSTQFARKRPRDDQGPAGPPPRRPRYDKVPEAGRREMGHHTLAPPYHSSSYVEEWSHVATYARTPSPEPPRPLSLRIDTNGVNQVQPGYRRSAGQRSDGQRRQTNEYTPSPTQSQPPAFGNHTYVSNNLQRQNHREANIDSRPQLLSRLTDLGGLTTSPSEPAQHHPVPHHRVARGRPHKQPYSRTNHQQQQQPLEQRINNNPKSALIDRIKQGPRGYE